MGNGTEEKQPGEGQPSKASFHEGSTTQGGSNFGQGSTQLGKKSQEQGSQKSAGADYENEAGWDNEALRSSDLEEKDAESA